MTEHYRTFSAVFPLIIFKDAETSRILLHRRQNTGYQDGRWDFAGSGHVDEGETASQAVVRECREELGIIVKEDSPHFAHISHRLSKDRAYYDLYFTVCDFDGTPAVMEPEKCSDLKWFDLRDLPDDLIECRRQALLEFQRGNHYSEIDER